MPGDAARSIAKGQPSFPSRSGARFAVADFNAVPDDSSCGFRKIRWSAPGQTS